MSGVAINITIEAEAVKAMFAGLTAFGADMTGVMDDIGASMVVSTQERFLRAEDPDGNPWPISWRAQVQGGKTLIDKGLLFQSFTHNPGPAGVEWGTNVLYAAVHQFGATIKSKSGGFLKFRGADGNFRSVAAVDIPRRPYLGFNADDAQTVSQIIGDEIARLSAAGGVQ